MRDEPMMMFKMWRIAFIFWGFSIVVQPALAKEPVTSKAAATSVPTFHCLSLYWSPENGQAERKVSVKFRVVGQEAWHDGLPMRYNPIETPECKGDYRGSIVNL